MKALTSLVGLFSDFGFWVGMLFLIISVGLAGLVHQHYMKSMKEHLMLEKGYHQEVEEGVVVWKAPSCK